MTECVGGGGCRLASSAAILLLSMLGKFNSKSCTGSFISAEEADFDNADVAQCCFTNSSVKYLRDVKFITYSKKTVYRLRAPGILEVQPLCMTKPQKTTPHFVVENNHCRTTYSGWQKQLQL